MSALLTNHSKSLQLLFTEEIYQLRPGINKANTAEQASISENTQAGFDYLGENNRFFLCLVHEPESRYLDAADQELLQKIMQAKGMELKDVAILNTHAYPDAGFSRFKDFFSCTRICAFGIAPGQLGLPDMASNEAVIYEDVKVLLSFSLRELRQTQHKKVAFWNAMKNF